MLGGSEGGVDDKLGGSEVGVDDKLGGREERVTKRREWN